MVIFRVSVLFGVVGISVLFGVVGKRPRCDQFDQSIQMFAFSRPRLPGESRPQLAGALFKVCATKLPHVALGLLEGFRRRLLLEDELGDEGRDHLGGAVVRDVPEGAQHQPGPAEEEGGHQAHAFVHLAEVPDGRLAAVEDHHGPFGQGRPPVHDVVGQQEVVPQLQA